MPLVKRGEVWWIDIRHQGRRIRRSAQTGNKKQAQELHDVLRRSLPGGTMDYLFAILAREKASAFKVLDLPKGEPHDQQKHQG